MQETGKHVPERKVSLALSMGSAGLYGAVAVAMGFANKGTLQVFGLANTLLFLQMCTVILVVGALRVCGATPAHLIHHASYFGGPDLSDDRILLSVQCSRAS